MAVTKLADGQIPVQWMSYTLEEVAERNRFIQAGIVSPATFPLDNGGNHVTVPNWDDLTGDDTPHVDTQDLAIDSITSDKAVAPVIARAKAFGVSDALVDTAGDDPLGMIRSRFVPYWVRRENQMVNSLLDGLIANAAFAPLVHDISGTSGGGGVFSKASLLESFYLHGDRSDEIVAVGMHSAVKALLDADDLINYDQNARDFAAMRPTLFGKPVIIDDSISHADGVYKVIWYRSGAIGRAELSVKTPAEVERESYKDGGRTVVVQRRRLVYHVWGTSYVGTVSGTGVTNAELATGTNWDIVYDPRNIGLTVHLGRVAAD